MPLARQPAEDAGQMDEPAAPRLSACDEGAANELVWKGPDAELDQVLVPVDGEI